MSQLPSVSSNRVSTRTAMEESRRIREAYEARKRQRGQYEEDAARQTMEEEEAQASALFEMPNKGLAGKDWKERSWNLVKEAASTVQQLEAEARNEADANAPLLQDYDPEFDPRNESNPVHPASDAESMAESVNPDEESNPFEDDEVSSQRDARDAASNGHSNENPKKSDPIVYETDAGDAGLDSSDSVVLGNGPNEYMQVREGLGSSTYHGHLLKGVRLAIRNAKEVPGKGWKVELCQACDMEGENCPASPDPYLTNKPFKFNDGKAGVSRNQFYSYEEYGAMLDAANQKGDKPVFYGDLLPTQGADGSVSFLVDVDSLKGSQVPFSLKAHGAAAGAARRRAAEQSVDATDMGKDANVKELGKDAVDPKDLTGNAKDDPVAPDLPKPDAEVPNSDVVWDLRLKPKKKAVDPKDPKTDPKLDANSNANLIPPLPIEAMDPSVFPIPKFDDIPDCPIPDSPGMEL